MSLSPQGVVHVVLWDSGMFDAASSWRALGGPRDIKLAQIHRGDVGGAALVECIGQCHQLLALDLELSYNNIGAGPGLSLRLGLRAGAKIQAIPVGISSQSYQPNQVQPSVPNALLASLILLLLSPTAIWQPEAGWT